MLTKRASKVLKVVQIVRMMSSANTSYCSESPVSSPERQNYPTNTALDFIHGVEFESSFQTSESEDLSPKKPTDPIISKSPIKSKNYHIEMSRVPSSPLKMNLIESVSHNIDNGIDKETPNLSKNQPVETIKSSEEDEDVRIISTQILKLSSEPDLNSSEIVANEPSKESSKLKLPLQLANKKSEISNTISNTSHQPLCSISNVMSPPHKRLRVNKSSREYSTASKSHPTLQLATQHQSNGSEVKAVKPMILSKEQQHILDLATYGTSLFFTGSAGTGKSVLLRAIIKSLREKHERGTVAVTASTGLAACNIGGITLHSFAGVGLGDSSLDKLVTKAKRNKKAYHRWISIKVLIIDEVSMIDGAFLDKLDYIARKLRKSERPFGGIQLIVSGDFYQLPPVSKKNLQTEEEESMFAFESNTWKNCIQCTLILKEVFRQKGDQGFIEMLNEIRTGVVSTKTANQFKVLERNLADYDGIEAAELFPTRLEVERANNKKLQSLPGNASLYKSVDGGKLEASQQAMLLSSCLAAKHLFLKKNAQVMCIKNIDDTLVNGSLGQVVDFMDRDTYMVYNEIKTNPEGPALDLEKQLDQSRKASLKSPPVDLPGASETEVKASQTNLNSSQDSIFAFLENIDSSQEHSELFEENRKRKLEILANVRKTSKGRKYPLVKFLLPDGYNTREVLVEPEEWTIEDENEEVLAKRVQLPLILAWSLSIHKSQGQTLPKVKIDLKNVFERGQAYVALSRAVSRRGLQVLNFRPRSVMAHEKVNRFYETLTSVASQEMDKPQIVEKKPKTIDEFMRM